MGKLWKNELEKALANIIYSVSVCDGDKIIGNGRIIGDGIYFLYIHDSMVVPKYQNKKIGSQIMNKLLEKINQIKTGYINDCYSEVIKPEMNMLIAKTELLRKREILKKLKKLYLFGWLL